MDQERARIQEDLRGVIDGEVRCDDLFLQLYSSDASIYQIKPRAVIRPRHVQDVVATVQYATEHGIAIHARGAGSGLAGESLGSGIVIDFSHFMRRIIDFAGFRLCCAVSKYGVTVTQHFKLPSKRLDVVFR